MRPSILLAAALLVMVGVGRHTAAAEVDDTIVEAIQDVLDEEQTNGTLSTTEFEALLRMAFDLDNHPQLLRCYKLNKDKPRAKLVSRMKLLVQPEPAKTASSVPKKEAPSKPQAAPRSDPPTKQAAAPAKKKAPPARTVAEEYQHRITAIYEKHNPEKVDAVPDLLRRSKVHHPCGGRTRGRLISFSHHCMNLRRPGQGALALHPHLLKIQRHTRGHACMPSHRLYHVSLCLPMLVGLERTGSWQADRAHVSIGYTTPSLALTDFSFPPLPKAEYVPKTQTKKISVIAVHVCTHASMLHAPCHKSVSACTLPAAPRGLCGCGI